MGGRLFGHHYAVVGCDRSETSAGENLSALIYWLHHHFPSSIDSLANIDALDGCLIYVAHWAQGLGEYLILSSAFMDGGDKSWS